MKQFKFLLSICLLVSFYGYGQSPVAQHGKISVKGNQIVNKKGDAVSFAGNSLFWSNLGWGGEKYYNAKVVKSLRNDWKSTIVRAAMGVEDNGGYLFGKSREKAKVTKVVDAAIAEGMYVIIDWHSHHAEDHKGDAVRFFAEMAKRYGKKDNVIYEIYNEPLAVSWSGTIKPYAEAVIKAIRAEDPDNLIIVGTPNWSQDVHDAASDPIKGKNIAYALHFYAGTHKKWLRDRADQAMKSGIALFVTEWGTVSASGDGAVDKASTNEWVKWMKARNVSHCNWALNDKAEGASALNSGASTSGAWSKSNYTASGAFVKDIIGSWSTSSGGGGIGISGCKGKATNIPGTLQAEDFCQMKGVKTELTADSGKGLNVGHIEKGDWLKYKVNVKKSGKYTVELRVASPRTTGKLQVKVGNKVLSNIRIPNTKGWQKWKTVKGELILNKGQQTLELFANGSGFNINWFKLSVKAGSPPSEGSVISQTIQAEDYDVMKGVKKDETNDIGAGLQVGYIDKGDWMAYTINVPKAGKYLIEYRVASPTGGGVISLEQDEGATVLGTVDVPPTNSWNKWTTISHEVILKEGEQAIAIGVPEGGYNINWWKFTGLGSALGTITAVKKDIFVDEELGLYPNPAKGVLHILREDKGAATVSIMTLNGQELMKRSFMGVEGLDMDIQQLQSGFYLIQVQQKSSVRAYRFQKID